MGRRCTNNKDGRREWFRLVRLLICAAVAVYCVAHCAAPTPIDDTPLEFDIGIAILTISIAWLVLAVLKGLSPGIQLRFVGLRFSSHSCPAAADAPLLIAARAPPR